MRIHQPADQLQTSSTGFSKKKRLLFSPGQFIQAVVLFSVGLSLTAIFGLLGGWPVLYTWVAGAHGMVLDSAIGILLAGTGLWLAQRRHTQLLRYLAGSLLLLGTVNLFMPIPRGMLHRLSFPFDASMRMSMGAIIALLLGGGALLLLSKTKMSLPVFWVIALLGAMISSIGLITLLGYVSGLTFALWWSSFFLEMAIPTALACCVLGSGLVASCFQSEGTVAQRFSLALAVSAVTGLLLLFVGVDAVWESSNAVVTAQSDTKRASDEIILFQTLVKDVRKAESGQRGYLLTGDRQYLNAFTIGQEGFNQIVRNSRGLNAKLLETMRLKLDELNRTIVLENLGRHSDALRLEQTSLGWRLTRDIEAQASIINKRLEIALAFQLDQGRRSLASVRTAVLWSCGMALLFAASALLLIATEMRRRSWIEIDLRSKEASLREQTVRAQDANRAKSSFLASMSHEIRTPMNAILGMADMLWESDLSPTQRRYVEVFRRAGVNLLALINDILDLSKIESGNLSLEKVDFDLREIVEQLLEILAPKAKSKSLAFHIHIESGTPTGLIGDPLRLQQVLLNLLGNAIKFTDRGEVSLRVRSHGSETEAALEFEISDTGIGIPADKLSSIFEDFTQAESSTTRRFGGTGLGLGICRRLIGQMGGDIRVHSEPGQGSTFIFNVVLPLSFEQENLSPVQFDEIAGRRVLIVQHDETDRVVLSEMCSAWGMSVATCSSGSEAVQLTKNGVGCQQFELVLVDRIMPDLEGFEAANQIRTLDRNIAILIVSSDFRAGDIMRCRELGYSGYLQKPVRRAALLQQIVKALSSKAGATLEDGKRKNLEEIVNRARRIQVLAAEDSEDNRFLLQAYCNGTAYELTFAGDGEQAVAAFAEGSFDLVMMDVQMPVMDGLTATREIRAMEAARRQKRTPILAITADALAEEVIQALEAGCDAHLAKPISKQTFLKALGKWQIGPQGAESPVRIEIPEGLEELAGKYLAARQQELPLLEGLLEHSDFDQLRRLSHNLKGTGTGYGFSEITRLGNGMEQASKDRDLTGLSGRLMELSAYVQAANQQMRAAGFAAG